jgi:hypothetical protein
MGRVIQQRAFEPAIVEQEAARLDQVDGNPETRRQP